MAGSEVIISPAITVICNVESITHTAVGASSFTWSYSVFKSIEGDLNRASVVLNPTSNEIYTLYDVDEAGCSNSASEPVVVEPCLGLSENIGLWNIKLYPHATVNASTLITSLEGTTTIEECNMLGEMIFAQTTDQENASIDLLGRALRKYLVKISDANAGFKTLKLVHQN